VGGSESPPTGSESPPTGRDPAGDLTGSISDTVEALFLAGGTEETLTRLVEVAVSTIEGCDYAGIFIAGGAEVTTPYATDPIVGELDGIQLRTGEGPCLDALSQNVAFYAEDLGADPRWGRFGPEAVTAGIRSLLALPLLVNGAPGALNLYARYPLAFGVIDRGRGMLLAAMAGMAFSSARNREDEDRRAANFQAALATREMIGQAQGILMERERISPDEAFDILRRASQHLNIKLRDIAQNLVETGERPDTGPSR
jgi:GAF domain-containing protein